MKKNKVELIGTLPYDISYYGKDDSIARTLMKVPYDFTKKNGEVVTLHALIRLQAFDDACEMLYELSGQIDKETVVEVNGYIATGSYEKDGEKVYTTDVTVTDVNIVPRTDATPKGNTAQKNSTAKTTSNKSASKKK